MKKIIRQLRGQSPFEGDIKPHRVPLLAPFSERRTLPFPHLGNYDRPIEILETYFHGAEQQMGNARHNRYLEVPGFAPVFVSRDPGIIRAITVDTGDAEGQFDRDTLPSTGIARATGKDTLLFANGAVWKNQKRQAASPFGKTALFQEVKFHEFEETFRQTIVERIELLKQVLESAKQDTLEVQLEPEIKAVMLEMLCNNFFGTKLEYEEVRNKYVPAIERVIEHIVRDTVTNQLGISIMKWPGITSRVKQIQADYEVFEELTSMVLSQRQTGAGLWKNFKSEAPDEALKSNLKVFLAGALEATTSFACWAISHLSRHQEMQQRVYDEVKGMTCYTPESIEQAGYLGQVLNETLRLTPSLYFLPRKATVDTWVETSDGRKLMIPKGTHILLDVWHANRHEDHWGKGITGYAADEFSPERWENISRQGKSAKDSLHFGFGHGPRVCPGKHLGQLEVSLVVGAIVKVFEFKAVSKEYQVKAGVSTKPADETKVVLKLRN